MYDEIMIQKYSGPHQFYFQGNMVLLRLLTLGQAITLGSGMLVSTTELKAWNIGLIFLAPAAPWEYDLVSSKKLSRPLHLQPEQDIAVTTG